MLPKKENMCCKLEKKYVMENLLHKPVDLVQAG